MEREKQAFELEFSKDGMFILNGEEVGIDTVVDGWNSYAETIAEQTVEIEALKVEIAELRERLSLTNRLVNKGSSDLHSRGT